MLKQIISSVISDNGIVKLVGNGSCDLTQLTKSPRGPIVAVDGGLRHVLKAGLSPAAVIGDMDSADLSELQALSNPVDVYKCDDQDTTDFEKALLAFDASVFLAYGFLGLRVDHMLACLSVLARFVYIKKVILVGSSDLLHVTKGQFSMKLSAGARVSLWPISPVQFAASSGLVWPVDGLKLAPDGQVATSNQMQEDWLSIEPETDSEGSYAVCCAPEFLPQMIQAAATA